MKKIAIAAALTALATAASAQNVTVYGVMDTSIQQYDAGTGSKLTRFSDNTFASSRLGFKGSEDLGGGLKAIFALEGSIAPNTGVAGSSTSNQTFNRESYVGLSGGFGEVRFGRQDTSWAQDIDSKTGSFGNFGNRAVNGTNVELGTDQSSVIKYTAPKMGPLTLQAGYGTNASGSTTDAGADQWSVYASAEFGKLQLHAGYGELDAATEVAKRDFTAVGANYDFGFAKVGANYGEGDTSTTATVKSKSSQASVSIPLSNGLTAHGVYYMTENGAQATANKGTGYTLGVTKSLSKRTTLYAAYASADNEANSSMYFSGLTAPAAAGYDTSSMTVGIAHSF